MAISYKQAIIVGAAPLGAEKEQLLNLLKWAGYENKSIENSDDSENAAELKAESDHKKTESGEDCTHSCSTCAKACAMMEIEKDAFVIAADGGLQFFIDHHMHPDFWVGDADSLGLSAEELSKELKGIPYEQAQVEKDDTDMALAVATAYNIGYRSIVVYGGLGGNRISHSLANIQLMNLYAKKGCEIKMMGEGIRMEVLYNTSKGFSSAMKGNLSIISLSDQAKAVSIKGLKYEFEGTLTSDYALGVSNSFTGNKASVSVGDGSLLLIFER